MRLLLDANVLYPTVPRALFAGLGRAGAIAPLWSARIVEEWRRAVLRDTPDASVGAEIALWCDAFAAGEVAVPADAEAALSLPDDNDRHVLAAAIAGRAEAIVTFNMRDFPGRALARVGMRAAHPDAWLTAQLGADPGGMAAMIAPVLADVSRVAPPGMDARAILKKARLPRLAKAWARRGA